MRHARLFAVTLGALLLCYSAAADAIQIGQEKDVFTIHFDEDGTGTVNVNGGPVMMFNGTLKPDPSNGMRPALIWDLSAIGQTPVGNGDIGVYESGGLSDVLRFTDSMGRLTDQGGTAPTATLMIFYSAPVPRGQLADTGFPANLFTGNFATVSENPDGTFFYGFGPGTNNYFGTSPPIVPEPSSRLPLFSLALVVGLAAHKRVMRAKLPPAP